MSALYNHAYTIGFSLETPDPTGEQVPAEDLRRAILLQLATLDDTDLRENIGTPFDTYVVPAPETVDPVEQQIEEKFDLPTLLELIAKDELGLKTLVTRNSDSLDFHDLSVWKLRAALHRAYQAGRNSAGLPTARKGDNSHA